MSRNIRHCNEIKMKKSATVIISVYNHFEWLRLILDALRLQTFTDFEVIVADDGSSKDNVDALRDYIESHPKIHIIHSWHADEGWRKNKALNSAVRRSSGEYLIFIDGDCIPHPRFVEDHVRLARHGIVTGGRRVETSKEVSGWLESLERLPKNYFSQARRLMLSGMFRNKFSQTCAQLRRTWRFPWICGKPIGIKTQGILGANFGLYRDDFEKVNGFDERYVHAGTGEDCDLDVRLENAGIHHVKASHYALMLHRCHDRLDWNWPENAELLRKAMENRITYVETGLRNSQDSSKINLNSIFTDKI